jgi:hypothetical protein
MSRASRKLGDSGDRRQDYNSDAAFNDGTRRNFSREKLTTELASEGQRSVDIPAGTKPANDAVAILLSELLAATALTSERRAGHWIPMHSKQLRAILGSRYKAVIHEAMDANYIEANDHYAVDRFSKSYRLSKEYRRPSTQTYELRRCMPSASRIRIEEADTVGRMLVEQFAKVQINDNLTHWDGYCATQIRRGTFYATRCKYGRFHSTFTGLKREARSQLFVNGERLIEMDIANCQPLIVGLLARYSQHGPSIAKNRHQQQPQHTHLNDTGNTYTICGASLLNYIGLCENGELYEYMVRRCHGQITLRDCIPVDQWHRHAVDRPLKREDIKRQYLVMLFADIATTKKMPLFDIVGNDWSTLADFILAAKSDCYQNLARDCQRLESLLMIDGAAKAMLDEKVTPIITIHDSIMTDPKHEDVVKAVVINQFAEMGVTPYIRRSRC